MSKRVDVQKWKFKSGCDCLWLLDQKKGTKGKMASGVNFELRTSHFPESYGGIKLCAAFFTAVEMKLPPHAIICLVKL